MSKGLNLGSIGAICITYSEFCDCLYSCSFLCNPCRVSELSILSSAAVYATVLICFEAAVITCVLSVHNMIIGGCVTMSYDI